MSNEDRQIQEKVTAFVGDLTSLVRALALTEVSRALGVGGGGAARAIATVKPAARASTRSANQPKAAKAPSKAAKAGAGGRRDSAVINALAERVAAYVAANPKQGVRAIGAALGATTHDLERPIVKLLAAGRIKKSGERSDTIYFK